MTGFRLPEYRPQTRTLKTQQAFYLATRPDAVSTEGGRPLNVGAPHKTCQFPFGDVGDADFHFCGDPVTPQSSYCADHHAKCWYVPDAKRSYLVRAAGA